MRRGEQWPSATRQATVLYPNAPGARGSGTPITPLDATAFDAALRRNPNPDRARSNRSAPSSMRGHNIDLLPRGSADSFGRHDVFMARSMRGSGTSQDSATLA